jgi:hypothetical protein
MIEGITAKLVTQQDTEQSTQAAAPNGLTELALTDNSGLLALSVFLVVGPPDPNALSYLVPRAVFERGAPVHVGALSNDDTLLDGLLEILEVMDTGDVAVFLCENTDTIKAARVALGVQ